MKISNLPQNTAFASLFKKERTPAAKTPATSGTIHSVKNFFAAQHLQEDVFTPKIIETYMPGPHGSPDIRGRLVKNITLKNTEGKPIPGFIIQEIEDANSYYACTEKCALCEMSAVRAHPTGVGYIYINSLYGQNNKGDIRGAGTELIKFAIQKSKDMGCDGRVELCMAGSLPFYFKNNFRAGKGYVRHAAMDAFFDYITRHNLDKAHIHTEAESPTLILDEKGAEALLLGVRFFDKSKSETMYSKTIECTGKNGKTHRMDVIIDFSDLSDTEPEGNTFVIQAISKDLGRFYQAASLEMQLLEDENGKKFFEAKNLNIEKMGQTLEMALIEEMFKAAETKAKEFDTQYINTEILNIHRE